MKNNEELEKYKEEIEKYKEEVEKYKEEVENFRLTNDSLQTKIEHLKAELKLKDIQILRYQKWEADMCKKMEAMRFILNSPSRFNEFMQVKC